MLVRACFALISRMSPINVPQDTSDSVITVMPSLTVSLRVIPTFFRRYLMLVFFGREFDIALTPRIKAEGLPSPKRQKPYQGQPVVDTLYEVFFKNAKSIGSQFAQRFVDIAKNKAGRPEVPIPMVAIVSTAVSSYSHLSSH